MSYNVWLKACLCKCLWLLQDVTGLLRFVHFWHPPFLCNATPIAVMCFPGFSLRWSLWCWVVLGDWYQDDVDVDIEKYYIYIIIYIYAHSAWRFQSRQKATLTKKHRLRHSWGALTRRLQMTSNDSNDCLNSMAPVERVLWFLCKVTQKGWLCNPFTEFSKDWIGFHIEEDGGKNGLAFFIEAIPAPHGLQSIVKTVKGAYIVELRTPATPVGVGGGKERGGCHLNLRTWHAEGRRPILGLCWPILGLCWPILGLCWPILRLCWPMPSVVIYSILCCEMVRTRVNTTVLVPESG